MSERYRLKRLLGRGGMAEVFLGVAVGAEGFERPVAIKRVLPHLASDLRIADMFISEARLSMHLGHQNIVQVVDVGRSPSGLFIVMELVNGWDLGVVLDAASSRARLPAPIAAYVASQVMTGLSHAYRKTLGDKPLITAHRDISPSNVLVSYEGEVKVADFGIARFSGATRATEPGTFKGKLAYAAPELLRGEVATHRSDQFALGVVLYEMLSGRLPYGNPDNMLPYMEALAQGLPAPLPDVPAALWHILSRAMAPVPDERFGSPDELGKALAKYLASCGEAAGAPELAELVRGLGLPPPALELPADASLVEGSETVWLTSVEAVERSGTFISAQAYAGTGYIGQLEEGDEPYRAEAALDVGGAVVGSGSKVSRCSGCATVVPEGQRYCQSCAPPKRADGPLELDRKEPLSMFETPELTVGKGGARSRRPIGAGIWALFALCAVGGGALVLRPTMMSLAAQLPAGAVPLKRAAPMLAIQSEPAEATVFIAGVEVGKTPYFRQNDYPERPIQVELRRPGYRPWVGSFVGGTSAEVDADLVRK